MKNKAKLLKFFASRWFSYPAALLFLVASISSFAIPSGWLFVIIIYPLACFILFIVCKDKVERAAETADAAMVPESKSHLAIKYITRVLIGGFWLYVGFFIYGLGGAAQDVYFGRIVYFQYKRMLSASQAIDTYKQGHGQLPSTLIEAGFDDPFPIEKKAAQMAFNKQKLEIILTFRPNLPEIANKHLRLAKIGELWQCTGDLESHWLRGSTLPNVCSYSATL